MIGIYIPTYRRSGSLPRVVQNIRDTTAFDHKIVLVVEKDDPDSLYAALESGADVVLTNLYEPSYSNAIQTAYERVVTPYFIAANDDFDFQPRWDIEALRMMGGKVKVVGINDGSPHNNFNTIALVDRRYISSQSGTIDIPNRVFYPYKHNYVDTEFHATAVARGVFRAAPASQIVHRHPDWGYVANDDTYKRSKTTISEDGHTFNTRSHLWQSIAA